MGACADFRLVSVGETTFSIVSVLPRWSQLKLVPTCMVTDHWSGGSLCIIPTYWIGNGHLFEPWTRRHLVWMLWSGLNRDSSLTLKLFIKLNKRLKVKNYITLSRHEIISPQKPVYTSIPVVRRSISGLKYNKMALSSLCTECNQQFRYAL